MFIDKNMRLLDLLDHIQTEYILCLILSKIPRAYVIIIYYIGPKFNLRFYAKFSTEYLHNQTHFTLLTL